MNDERTMNQIHLDEFEPIIGYGEVKTELRQIASVLRNGAQYAAMGVKAPRGLLLHGDPGLGKSLMSECLIKASGRPVFTCRKDESDGAFVNVIKKTFLQAKAQAPSIVYLDDMDKFANADDRHRNAEEYVAVQSCINEVKGLDVFVLATANEIHVLPPSLVRAGRFDRVIEIESPGINDASDIIAHYLEDKPVDGSVDAHAVARVLDGRSCAVLEAAINEAGIIACYEGATAIDETSLIKTYLKVTHRIPNTSCFTDPQWDESMIGDFKNERSFASWHEAGHALVAEVIDPGCVTVITNISYQGKVNGVTSYSPTVARTDFSRTDFQALTGLAGMAATDCRFGIQGAGAHSDRFGVIRAIIASMSKEGRAGFACSDFSGRSDNSEAHKAGIEHAANVQLELFYARAKQIVAMNREFLDKLALAIAQKGLLFASDVQAIKETCTIMLP